MPVGCSKWLSESLAVIDSVDLFKNAVWFKKQANLNESFAKFENADYSYCLVKVVC